MKFVLIFLMSALVVTTHQYFHDQRMEMPWLMPYSPDPVIQKYEPYVAYYHAPVYQNMQLRDEEALFSGLAAVTDNSEKDGNDQQYEFLDTQSRVKGFNQKRPTYVNEQPDGRLLYNLLATSGTYTNPFFKTAIFTSTISLNITSVVVCIPSNQVLNGLAATTCRRKRRALDIHSSEILDDNQFVIAPTETVKFVPTALTSLDPMVNQLSSSKEDTALEDASVLSRRSLREKRFLFLNKNQFVVSSTVTTFLLSSTTVTIRRNLFANQGVACAAVAAANVPECIACLPAGAIVCPANAG